jgi:hypothetical protein
MVKVIDEDNTDSNTRNKGQYEREPSDIRMPLRTSRATPLKSKCAYVFPVVLVHEQMPLSEVSTRKSGH